MSAKVCQKFLNFGLTPAVLKLWIGTSPFLMKIDPEIFFKQVPFISTVILFYVDILK